MPVQAKRRLHWFCSQPTPYNDFLFSALANSGAFDLLVHFRKIRWPSHPWRVPFKASFSWRCPIRWGWIDVEAIRLALSERRSYFILAGWEDPWMLVVAMARIARGSPFAIWTDCPNPKARFGLKRILRARWLAYLFSKADKVLVTGEAGAKLLAAMNCPAEKLVVFPYWVAVPPTPKAPPASSPLRFICLGRLDPIKRFDLAICALEQVSRERGAGKAALTLVGEGPQRHHLQNLVESKGLQGCVRFLGWKEHAEAMQLLEDSDVLVHPADWEPYGVVVLEAMTLAKPVIASDHTMAAVDRVRVGANGFLFKSGDAQDLAGCMLRFVIDRNLIAQMGRQARLTAEEWPANRAIALLKQVAGIA